VIIEHLIRRVADFCVLYIIRKLFNLLSKLDAAEMGKFAALTEPWNLSSWPAKVWINLLQTTGPYWIAAVLLSAV